MDITDLNRVYKSYQETVLSNPLTRHISFGEYLFSLRYDMPVIKVRELTDLLDNCYAQASRFKRPTNKG